MIAERKRHPGGRPRLTFDLRQVEELGRIQSTQAELASVLGCGLSTVKDRLVSDEEFSTAYKRGLEAGKSSLRRLQWKSAVAGNVVMQIWLGKQYLGQRDVPIVVATELAQEPNDWLAQIKESPEVGEALVRLEEAVARADEAMKQKALSAAQGAKVPALLPPEY